MKIFTSFRPTSLRPVVGIGNFDGAHLGHRRILQAVVESAAAGGEAGVITFQNHPRLPAAELLTTSRQRLEYFRRSGITACWICDFDSRVSRLTGEEFIDRILVERLGVAGVCVGAGFRFGAGRDGSVELLRRRGAAGGFLVREIPTVRIAGREVRSSLVREEVKKGRLEEASLLLGRPYCLTGRVVRGWGWGRKLGYPTANFIPEQLLPAPGIYLARIEVGVGLRSGLLYLGTRPTFPAETPRPPVAEAHIFDWSGGLGGRRIKVSLLKRLRKDIKFKNKKLLMARMKEDEREARVLLASGER